MKKECAIQATPDTHTRQDKTRHRWSAPSHFACKSEPHARLADRTSSAVDQSYCTWHVRWREFVLGSDDLAGSVEVPETLRDAPRSAAAASNVSTCVHNIHTSIDMSTKFSCGVVVNCRS